MAANRAAIPEQLIESELSVMKAVLLQEHGNEVRKTCLRQRMFVRSGFFRIRRCDVLAA